MPSTTPASSFLGAPATPSSHAPSPLGTEADSGLRSVHNGGPSSLQQFRFERAARVARQPTSQLALVSVPRDALASLSNALNAATIDTALLDALIRGGVADTEMGRAMAEELAKRCALPTVTDTEEQASWRSVLCCALSLPAPAWTVECVAERARLGAAAAQADPVLQRLRDALYRPVDVSRTEWEARLDARRKDAPGADSRDLALAHQRAQLPRSTTAERHAWVKGQLRELAPSASPETMQRAMRLIRRHEQRDGGLLDMRAGLPAVFDASCGDPKNAQDPASIAAIHAQLQRLASPHHDATSTAQGVHMPLLVHALAEQLLQVARQAQLDRAPALTPLGRYDSVSRALVSLLSSPWQLNQLAGAAWDTTFAATVAARELGSTRLPSPERVAEAADAFGRADAWMRPASAALCTPLPGERNSGMDTQAATTRALLGRPPASTALAVPGQCREATWRVAGLRRLQTRGIGAFLGLQHRGGDAADTVRPTDASPPAAASADERIATTAETWTTTRARAGALTEPGRPTLNQAQTPHMTYGASAQFMVPMQGYLPLNVLVPLLDGIPRTAWWNAFDWQTPRTLPGLRVAVEDLFAHANIALDQRAPSFEVLEGFFASAPVLHWFDVIRELPAAEGARRNLARGGEDIRVYAFTLMLQHLLRRTRSTGTEEDRAAMHLLSRIATQCVGYLQGLDGTPADAFVGAFEPIVARSQTAASSSAAPLTEAMLLDHAARLRDAQGVPLALKPDQPYVRAWLVQGEPPVLDPATFASLSSADALLANIMVTLRRKLDDYRFGKHWAWREAPPTPQDWRDHLDRRAKLQGTPWQTELGVLIQQVAASLRRYHDLQVSTDAPIGTGVNDLRVLTRALVEPLLHLYTSVHLPMDEVDPHYASAYRTCTAFFELAGTMLSSDPGIGLDANMVMGGATRLRALLPSDTANLPLPQAVLQYLLGHSDFPADAAALDHATLLLHRGERSRQLIGRLLEVDSDAVGPDLARRFFRLLANADEAGTLGDWRAELLRGSDWQVSPAEWLTLQPPDALASAWHTPTMANPREGLVRWIHAAMDSTWRARNATDLPAHWTRIIDGPHALDEWLASDVGEQALRDVLRTIVPGGLPVSRLDQQAPLSTPTRIAVLAAAVEAQLQQLPRGIATNNELDGAPALSLAIELSALYPALDAAEALAFATALLDADGRAVPTARAPLQFPVLSNLTEPSPISFPTALQLDAPDALLERFGFALLQPDPGSAEGSALRASEQWELMSRTRQFANYCRPLLAQLGWYGGGTDQAASPRGAQALLARLMLEQYIGMTHIEAMRERLASPASLEETYVALAGRIRTLIAERQPHASAAAHDLLYWMLVRELQQPTLLVEGIPEWLYYGRSLQAAAFHHGATLLDALQPGATERAHFDDVCALPSQLARPPHHAGDLDDLHDAWAKAMLPSAVLYATAEEVIEPTRTDVVSAEQARTALDHLQARQRLHALHVAQLDTRPPQRMEIAAHTLTTADVDPKYWAQRPDELPEGYLVEHGIAPSEEIEREVAIESSQTAFFHPFPVAAHVTAYDSLQALLVSDAYGVVGAPTTATLFERTFTLYQQRLEGGLASIIGMLLEELPAQDRQVLMHATCVPLRVQHAGRDADRGIVLRCIATDAGLPDAHFEVFPSAGVIRRLRSGEHGEMIELDGFVSGQLTRQQDPGRWRALPDVTLVPSEIAVQGDGPDKLDLIAKAAANHLWQPFLERTKQAALARRTGLEHLHEEDRRLRLALLEFAVPFFRCVEEIVHQDSSGAALDCTLDAGFALLPFGGFVASTVRVLDSAGVRSIHALCEEAGSALLKLAAGLAEQSGVFALRDVARATFWMGSTAFNSALDAAAWLRRVLRGGTLLDNAAMTTEYVLAAGKTDAATWHALTEATPSLGLARLADGSIHPVSADGLQWYPWDAVAKVPFGPALPHLEWHGDHLPQAFPVHATEDGREINLGSTDDAVFTRRSPTQWEVVVHGVTYRLDAADPWLRRHPHEPLPHETGTLEPVGTCRTKRGLEPAACSTGLRLRFVPDTLTKLGAAPTLTELGGHALSRREYMLVPQYVVAPDGTRTEVRLMVHEGKVQKWIVQATRRNPAVNTLVPLSAWESNALGVPQAVEYPQQLSATLSRDPTLGLPDTVDAAERDALYRQMPVILVGPLVATVADGRRLRGVVIDGHVYLEPDTGVFYRAPLPAEMTGGTGLTFTRLSEAPCPPVSGGDAPPAVPPRSAQQPETGARAHDPGFMVIADEEQPALPDVHAHTSDRSAINAYLREVERYRMARLYGAMEQDRENIARLAFGHLQAHFRGESLEQYTSYEAYRDDCRDTGRANVLIRYADGVLSGASSQRIFVRLARTLIPDWRSLATGTREERQGITDILNQLLPVAGKQADWTPLSANTLLSNGASRQLMYQLNGVNLAFAEVILRDGRRVVYYALSDGKKAAQVTLRDASRLRGDIRYVNARQAVRGKPNKPTYTSLPVLRDVDDNKQEIVFFRGKDSEVAIADAIANDPDVDETEITSFRLFSLLSMCPSCGGVTLPQLFDRLPNAETFSIRYLREYRGTTVVELPPPVVAAPQPPAEPDPALRTYYRQWLRGLQAA
ncbi:deaminase domain-containing protein [Stenotrophomonas sp. PD6]|uniref:deaminase domain-containing protein n=1 Tax=Stenotrophomonas sp. PD6 TaxID=3368612 RepID=UPI003B9F5DC8